MGGSHPQIGWVDHICFLPSAFGGKVGTRTWRILSRLCGVGRGLYQPFQRVVRLARTLFVVLLRGVTAVKFRDYALGCVGMIPGTVAYVFIGTTASGLLEDDDEEEASDDGGDSTVQLIVLIVGGIATVIAVVLISIYAKRALNKVLEEDRIAQEGLEGGFGTRGDGAERGDVEQGAEEVTGRDGKRPEVVEHAVRMPV